MRRTALIGRLRSCTVFCATSTISCTLRSSSARSWSTSPKRRASSRLERTLLASNAESSAESASDGASFDGSASVAITSAESSASDSQSLPFVSATGAAGDSATCRLVCGKSAFATSARSRRTWSQISHSFVRAASATSSGDSLPRPSPYCRTLSSTSKLAACTNVSNTPWPSVATDGNASTPSRNLKCRSSSFSERMSARSRLLYCTTIGICSAPAARRFSIMLCSDSRFSCSRLRWLSTTNTTASAPFSTYLRICRYFGCPGTVKPWMRILKPLTLPRLIGRKSNSNVLSSSVLIDTSCTSLRGHRMPCTRWRLVVLPPTPTP